VNNFYNNNEGLPLLTGLEIDTKYLKELNVTPAGIFDKLTNLTIKNELKKEIVIYAGLEENYTSNKEK
jgi:hypothetical protein